MIDFANFTNYNRTEEELQEMLLFCIMVAGKRSDAAARSLDGFLAWVRKSADQWEDATPFECIRAITRGSRAGGPSAVAEAIKVYNNLNPGLGIGQLRRMGQAMTDVAYLFNTYLKEVSFESLCRTHGIGPKTASLFLVHSREGERRAILDTHLLKYLRKHEERLGLEWGVPQHTPANIRVYRELEAAVLAEADRLEMTPAAFDLWVWRQYSESVKEGT
mgnify:CR=1 FL=1